MMRRAITRGTDIPQNPYHEDLDSGELSVLGLIIRIRAKRQIDRVPWA
ncbi:hypothetical protein ADIS_3261 [Lunatimonas lonarensis]|uniref:Uncharacterized protein n=1 Tax=Lunatimonas lonarensis TaxID=1232681 RepID=R7ZQ08_9BACT|nr:hypothetical protein ADIS_3261 [Lunatimonas lonarensis]